ncbi:RNA polymerase sigma factor [Achromobacter marplatensis]|uniref:RNA polymerase sigma factor n=1 Tax=Achromobacter marplatensis TaxID=470868 RepID=UPI0039F67105
MPTLSNRAATQPAMPPLSGVLEEARRTSKSIDALFSQLFCEHGNRLHRFVTRRIGNETEAADITQQTFIEASNAYANFRGDSKLSTWLYGIALNLIRNHLSRAPEKRYCFVDETALTNHVCLSPNPQQILEERQVMNVLLGALESLPDSVREILQLAAVENLSYEEIAQTLNVPMGTVRSRLSRARASLRQRMEALGVVLNF